MDPLDTISSPDDTTVPVEKDPSLQLMLSFAVPSSRWGILDSKDLVGEDFIKPKIPNQSALITSAVANKAVRLKSTRVVENIASQFRQINAF